MVTLFCNAVEKHNAFVQVVIDIDIRRGNSIDNIFFKLKNLAIERLADESIRERFSKSSLCDKLIPKLCKEACKNPEASVKIQALYILSLFSVKNQYRKK